jgi:3-dehydroquinate dehydratase
LDELKEVLDRMKKYNPQVYKIAVMPNSEKDVEVIYKLVDYFK